ncbi:MAG: nucleoside hydrolase [Oscillospiraceae bacterium]|nr:nucleoside hydrolase [Oscillospiraceae bacterium]MBQ6493271.1 nucleoside hydrolase [Erysipelotrichaceae bacterium]
MKKIPILIDTDPGVDDFFCISIGCAFKELFDLRAITTIGGNNSTDVTTQNALDILKLLDREDVPVARGAGRFLTRTFGDPVAKFHGLNGLGNVEIAHSDRDIDRHKAWDKIYEEARIWNGELVVVTVGPETNLAMAFIKYPMLSRLLKKIVVMGGTLTTGNVSEYAEANIWNDAEAAKIVFESGVPIDMVGLNVTRKAPLKRSVFDGLENINEDVKDVMLKLIEFRNEESMHDAIAISSLVRNDIIVWKDAYTHIIDGEVEKRGMSVAEYDQRPNSRVAVDINIENYYKVIREMITRF